MQADELAAIAAIIISSLSVAVSIALNIAIWRDRGLKRSRHVSRTGLGLTNDQ